MEETMNYSWLDAYCIAKKGCQKDFKQEWQATRYMLMGKMFAMQGTDNTSRPMINLKIEPSYGALLRQEHKDIVPGYYMNKLHWNCVYLDGAVPDALLKEMVDESYQILFASLSKKAQLAILNEG